MNYILVISCVFKGNIIITNSYIIGLDDDELMKDKVVMQTP
ncbi:MAG: hypothetical protein ACFFBP_08605 [Promethearchaeota archaeon]